MARSLFLLGCAFAGIAALALYGSYRCLRGALRSKNTMPVRDATFAAMAALVVLANALRERMIEQMPAPESNTTPQTEDEPEAVEA